MPTARTPREIITDHYQCPDCGYELVGLPTGIPCPDCGEMIPTGEPSGAGEVNLRALFADLARLGPAAWLGLVWAFLPLIGGFVLLWQIGRVDAWLGGFSPVVAWLIFAAILALSSGFGLLPTYAQAVLAGWAFGPVLGTSWALAGIVGGSLIGMLIARATGRDRAERLLAEKPKWLVVRDALVKSGRLRTLGIVTLIRVPPNSPFSLTNLVLTISGVPLVTYVIATAVGILPRTAIVVSLGHGLQLALRETDPDARLTEEAVKQIDKPWWLVAGGIAIAIGVLIAISRIAESALQKLAHEAGREEAAGGHLTPGDLAP